MSGTRNRTVQYLPTIVVMDIYIEYYSYLILVFIAFITSIISWRRETREDKILSCLLLLTFVSELIGMIMARKYQNNLSLFHFFAPIQFLFIALYFITIDKTLRKNHIGFYVMTFGVTASIVNSLFIQKTHQFNSYYILFEGFIVIAMTLHFFYTLILKDKVLLFRSKHFWIAVIFLFFWSMTYTYWALFGAIVTYANEYGPSFGALLRYANIITYAALSIVFILNKKQILHNGN